MARRGFGGMNALRAALGAATGVAEGLQQRDLLAEEKRKQALLEARQKAQEDALLRQEQRDLRREGYITADRLSGLTMPGATPLASMQPTMRQKVGEQEFVYVPSVAQAEKHKADVMARSLTRAEKGYEQQQEEKTLTRLIGEAKKGGRTSEAAAKLAAASKGAYDALFPEPRGGGGGGRAALSRQDTLDEAEAWFNTPEPDAARRKMIAQTFNNLRKAKGNENRSARELIKATYDAVMARDASQYKQAQTGRIEAQTNPGGMGSIFPGVQVPTNNAKIEEERKAFDDAVAEYGMQYVLSQGYRRP